MSPESVVCSLNRKQASRIFSHKGNETTGLRLGMMTAELMSIYNNMPVTKDLPRD
jgi:hypothetical protein